MATLGSRSVKVIPGDTLLLNGYRVDVTTLAEMLKPDQRVLWAFVRNGEHDIRPVPYDETRVVWLAEEDLVRSENDV
jgi:hypothetical protein